MLRWITAGESHGQALVAVLEGVPAGVEVTTDEIADSLVLSRETVRSHVKNILRKLHAANRAEANRPKLRHVWPAPAMDKMPLRDYPMLLTDASLIA